ncbi:MAG: endonuclease domain-containing protein [Chitinophagaceae bacterium]|nr:endonuclease domain-containing protein [Chitinophagaceae bacterium]
MSSPIRIARELRQKMTPEEDFLWQLLRNRGIKGKKVRRQHPVVYETVGWKKYFYVADFYCASRKLIIELDGKHHEFGEQKEYDKARDIIMNEMGLKIIRIKNEELENDIEKVMKKIEAAL